LNIPRFPQILGGILGGGAGLIVIGGVLWSIFEGCRKGRPKGQDGEGGQRDFSENGPPPPYVKEPQSNDRRMDAIVKPVQTGTPEQNPVTPGTGNVIP